ncbi:MAG: dTDP-4-dehydrorhamnose reductase, partial [Lachnospiraceae bacterium]
DIAESDGVTALDISDIEAVLALVRKTRPDVIINCAAHTNVDACEKEWDAAYRINAIGPRNLAIAAEKFGAKLVHVSTDYVFGGDGDRPYTEFDAPAPKSMYGATKLAGEEFVKSFSKHYFIVRTAWLYGDGKNFLRTMLRLSESHDEITVVDDQLGSPTSAAELARAIVSLLSTESYGIYHGTCEGFCSWADFTEAIFKKTGKSTKVVRVSTAQYMEAHPESAARPAYSVLDNYMLRLTGGYTFADWESALDEYLKEYIG